MKYRDDVFLLLGRAAFAGLFIPNGLGQLFAYSRFASSLARHGFPLPDLVACLALFAELAGSLLILFGYDIEVGALLLILFCIGANFSSHRYWLTPIPERSGVMLQFYKNIALMGGLLFLCVAGPGKFSLAGRLPSLFGKVWPQKTR